MRSKSLLILAAVTVIAVIMAAVSVYQRRAETAVAAAPDALFPTLQARINEVAALEVVTPSESFTVTKAGTEAGGGWQLEDRSGYPVKFGTVKQAVVGVASLEPLEPRTAKPELYHRLRVATPEPGKEVEGAGTMLRLLDSEGQAIAAIVVGKAKSVETSSREGWYYVRKPDETRSWLAAGRLDLPDGPIAWLNDEIVTVERARVRAGTAIQPDGAKVTVSRETPKTENFQVEDIPAGGKPMHETVANGLGSALGFLSFEDVKPASEIDFAGGGRAVFHTFDGLVLTIRLAELDGKTWARFEASFDKAQAMLDELDEAQREGLKKADAVREEAAHINERFGGWAYLLPEHKAKDFKTDLSDLVVFETDGEKGGDGKS